MAPPESTRSAVEDFAAQKYSQKTDEYYEKVASLQSSVGALKALNPADLP